MQALTAAASFSPPVRATDLPVIFPDFRPCPFDNFTIHSPSRETPRPHNPTETYGPHPEIGCTRRRSATDIAALRGGNLRGQKPLRIRQDFSRNYERRP